MTDYPNGRGQGHLCGWFETFSASAHNFKRHTPRWGVITLLFLFALYIDNVVMKVNDSILGCYMKWVCTSILLYADDILLVAPSVTSLQQLLHLCEQELDWLGMSLNVKKSACIRIGPRFNINCCNIVTGEGHRMNSLGLTLFDTLEFM